MSYIKLIIWVLAFTFCAIILIQNANQLIQLRFLFWESNQFEAIILFLFGISIGVLLVLPALLRHVINAKRKVMLKQKGNAASKSTKSTHSKDSKSEDQKSKETGTTIANENKEDSQTQKIETNMNKTTDASERQQNRADLST